jgi:hypothetical protein
VIAGLALLVVVVLAASLYSIWSTVKNVSRVYDDALQTRARRELRRSMLIAPRTNF